MNRSDRRKFNSTNRKLREKDAALRQARLMERVLAAFCKGDLIVQATLRAADGTEFTLNRATVTHFDLRATPPVLKLCGLKMPQVEGLS